MNKHHNQNNGLYVIVKDKNLEKAIKQFKNKVKKSNLMIELQEREFYVKPSVRKRKLKIKANTRNKYKDIEK